MPSAQIDLIVETEKKAFQIEQDAKAKAREIVESGNDNIKKRVSAVEDSVNAQTEAINADLRKNEEQMRTEEERRAADQILILRQKAESNRNSAIEQAVRILSGKT